MAERKLEVQLDEDRDEVVINGVRYASNVFRFMANPNPRRLYQFRRDGDVVVVSEWLVGPIPE